MVDPVAEVDGYLSELFLRPQMFAGPDLAVLEALVWQALYFRSVFANTSFDLRKISPRLLIEMTGRNSRALPFFVRLLEFYGETSFSDPDHPRHDEVIGFYRQLATHCQALSPLESPIAVEEAQS